MKILKLFFVLFCITSCAPIYVNYDYEKGTDFSSYKTYNFFSDIDSGLTGLDENRLISALETKLNAMGLTKSENASFLIDITSEEFQENQRNTVGVGVGGGNGGFGGGVSVGIPIGQTNINRPITIEFVDDSKMGLFWQAKSQSTFNPNSKPEKREAKIHALVEKILNGFPPE